jgi:type IV secretion system protein VirB1
MVNDSRFHQSEARAWLELWGEGSVLLPLATLTFLAASCAPEVAAETIAAIAQTESGRDPLAIHDNSTREAHHPAEKSEAAALARQLLRAGHSIDVGLMGINDSNWSWLGLTLDTALDPCSSIKAGATVLTQLSRYNTGSPMAGLTNGYATRVVTASLAIRDGTLPASSRPKKRIPPVARTEATEPAWSMSPIPADEDDDPSPPPGEDKQ